MTVAYPAKTTASSNSTAAWLMVFLRSSLFLAFQALFALIYG